MRDEDENNAPYSEDNVYLFSITSKSDKLPRTAVTIAGHNTQALIDTGSCINVVSNNFFDKIKDQVSKCDMQNVRVYAYLSESPIRCIGKFNAQIEANNKTTTASFVVTKNDGECLLSYETARELGLVTIVNTLRIEDLKCKYPQLFSDKIGKLDKYQLKLHIDESVKPTQPNFVPSSANSK